MLKTTPSINCNKNSHSYQFLFTNYTKSDWIKDLSVNDSSLFTIIKDDVEQLYKNTKQFVKPGMTIDDMYALSVNDTIRQFKKNLAKKNSWIETLDGENIYIKVQQRLVNNMKNLFDRKRRGNILDVNFDIFFDDTSIDDELSYSIDDDIKKILKNDKKAVYENLRKIYKENQISYSELEDICFKFCIDIVKIDIDQNCQMLINFDMEMIA